MKNAFYFVLKALFVIFIFIVILIFLYFHLEFLGMQKKRLDKKDKVNFDIYDVTAWLAKNYNTQIAQYLANERQPDNEMWRVNGIPKIHIFL